MPSPESNQALIENSDTTEPALKIFSGKVMHHRKWPKEHRFTYDVFMVLLDLQRLQTAFGMQKFWSYQRSFSLATFKESDYLNQTSQPLPEQIRQFILNETGTAFTGNIYLLTNLRYFGLRMNPISLFYCYCTEESSPTLQYIVAEVTNTPWKERHLYLLRCGTEPEKASTIYLEKKMHVSPFMEMPLMYEFSFSEPSEKLEFGLTLSYKDPTIANNQNIFHAHLNLHYQPMSTKALDRYILRYPMMTAKVALGIYWQALKLFIKGIPFVPHPKKLNTQPQ